MMPLVCAGIDKITIIHRFHSSFLFHPIRAFHGMNIGQVCIHLRINLSVIARIPNLTANHWFYLRLSVKFVLDQSIIAAVLNFDFTKLISHLVNGSLCINRSKDS